MTHKSALEADIVVAGAGHNSLIAAAYLAKAGFQVIVLEARSVIGGNTVTEELTMPGFRHDSCASAHVLIQANPLMRNNELGLDAYGLDYVFTDPAVVMPFDDGASITMWRDPARTVDELSRFSHQDAASYIELLREWSDVLKSVHAANMNSAPSDHDPSTRAEKRYAEIAEKSAMHVITDRFSEPHVQSFIAWLSFATIQDIRRPGTGILPFSVTSGRQEFGWALPRGGSIMLPNACAALIEAHGGQILVNAPVSEIIVEKGRAVGVATSEGRVVKARRAVLSTIHAALLPEVLPEGALPEDVVASAKEWRAGLTMFTVHLAVRGSPLVRVGDQRVESVALAIGSKTGLLEQIKKHDEGHTHPVDPWMLAVMPCTVDPARAPEGMSVMKFLSIGPRNLDGITWDEEKPRLASALLDRALKHTTLVEGDVLAAVAECPLDLEARNPHNFLGSCHGGELLPERSGINRPFRGWSEYRMPVAGLYQTGATTHPGGSVSGRPGRNAARVLLDDLGVDPRTVMA